MGTVPFFCEAKKTPPVRRGFGYKCLAVTYFHMGKPHTIIGAESFHFRVREGIGWFRLAIAARQEGGAYRLSDKHTFEKAF